MNQVKVIAADLDADTRSKILARFQPIHPEVFAYHVTAAYGKLDGVRIKGLYTAEVMGQVVTDRVQTLILRINGDDFRPDGKPWHLTVSVAHGVEPKEGGNITLEEAVQMEEFRFGLLFLRRNARRDVPEIYQEVSYAE